MNFSEKEYADYIKKTAHTKSNKRRPCTINDAVHFIIPIAPITKKNHSRIVTLGERCRCCGKGNIFKLIPSKQYEEYKENIKGYLLGLGKQTGTIDTPVNLKCIFYVKYRYKADLVGYLQAIQDLLVDYGVLEDDNRNIIASVDGSMVLHDKENPRTEITITKMENYEQWGTPAANRNKGKE